MRNLSIFEIGLIGFLAQMIDGTLGMGYGVTSSALLISFGIPPVIASASVHTSEVFTTLFSGFSHFKLGNIRKDLLLPLISFGVIGGILGACGLIKIPLQSIRFIVGLILLSMGSLIFYRFLFKFRSMEAGIKLYSVNRLGVLGFFAAFIDAIGGGGWGPICTPSLVITGTEPHKAVGSVNLAEFFITIAITLTFLSLIGPEQFRWDVVLALLMGGVIAAPCAASICKKLPKRILGIFVGLAVILLSFRMLLRR
ncbi:MAG: hypothetical protein AMJ95_02405 [Omnitrophica WOR_2 bacterium SM23_72]|nr:MAG: hypothetical protein AMJ95_02405 [Omnitrophica WOR_2 bacterium SM23_72]